MWRAMPKRLTLYRGDSIRRDVAQSAARVRGKTFAQYFCGDGLMAKFSVGGSDLLLDGRSLLDLVLAHVGYEVATSEQELADRSPLMSFSECSNAASRFSNRRGSDLEACDFGEASHFIWQFTVTLDAEMSPGRYGFKYWSDPVNVRWIVSDQFQRGMEQFARGVSFRSTLADPLAAKIAQVYADADQQEHYAEIIDVVTFVSAQDVSGCDQQLVSRTIERATKDREWLVYPMDPMPDGCGYSARLEMNKHLSVFRCFKRKQRAPLRPKRKR